MVGRELCTDIKEANLKAVSVLEKGADAIAFDLGNTLIQEKDLPLLLKDISINFSPVHFYTNASPLLFANGILNQSYHQIKGSFTYEPLTKWMDKKEFSSVPVKELASAITLLQEAPRYKLLNIDGSYFHEKEMGIIKEVAYSISLALDYIDRLTESGAIITNVLPNFEFSFPVGKNYFLQIAKLRAFRVLWNKITESCHPGFDSFTTSLHCITSTYYYSKENPYENIFQNTTEAMAAIIGGCDSLSITAFDKHSKAENEFSSRISRNISLILKEEAHFDKAVDPGAGSFYIENLTNDIAEKAWAIITGIEKKGGFIKAWEKNLID